MDTIPEILTSVHSGVMPYGNMPASVLLHKLEETNMGGDPSDMYYDFSRGLMVDKAPDAPFFDQDSKRDPNQSRTTLNLRMNGTRGSSGQMPQHPELFMGFTDPDPRGTQNDPRLDEFRRHTATRAGVLEVSMGYNNDDQIVESPWTNQSLSYNMKYVFDQTKSKLKVFTAERDGHVLGSNIVGDSNRWGTNVGVNRTGAISNGSESMTAMTAEGRGLLSNNLNSMGTPDLQNLSPWNKAVNDKQFAVQQYGVKKGRGRTDADINVARNASNVDQHWTQSMVGQGNNNQMLGATMATAIRARESKVANNGQHWAPSAQANGNNRQTINASIENVIKIKAATAAAEKGDTTSAASNSLISAATGNSRQTFDGSFENAVNLKAATSAAEQGNTTSAASNSLISMDTGNSRQTFDGSFENAINLKAATSAAERGNTASAASNSLISSATGKNLVSGKDMSKVTQSTLASASRNKHLTDAAMAVSRLRNGGGDIQKVGKAGTAEGVRPAALSERYDPVRHLGTPKDTRPVAGAGEAILMRTGAGDAMQVHQYKSAPVSHFVTGMNNVSTAQGGYDKMTWKDARKSQKLGKSKNAGEWRSNTQADTTIGASASQTFGIDMVPDHRVGAAMIGSKNLRGNHFAEEGYSENGISEKIKFDR